MPPTSLFLADQFNNSTYVVSTTDAAGTIGVVGIDFGFAATSVSIFNDKASTIYVSLNSTAGSTGGHKMLAGESLSFTLRLGSLSLASTTTSTGDFVRVLAVRA